MAVDGVDPTKKEGSDKWCPRIERVLAGFAKEDPATEKKLPVAVDVPETLVWMSMFAGALEVHKALGDWTLIAFYFLLRIGEYTVKGSRNTSKQTVQFKMEDVTFFKKDTRGRLRQVPRTAPDSEIMAADSATLKLDNQKNGWKNVCVNQEHNGDSIYSPVRALGRRYVHIRKHCDGKFKPKERLSAYWEGGARKDLTDEDVRAGLKWAASYLDYPGEKNISIDRVDTHSLRGGGANALHLAGYSDRQIQKMGRWRGETFKEYISEHLSAFTEGMSKAMMRNFKFVNIAGGANGDVVDVTTSVMGREYDNMAAAA